MLQQHAPWPGGGRGVESDDESLDGVASPWEYPPAAAEEAAATAIQKKVRERQEVFDEIYRVEYQKRNIVRAASERSYDTRVKCGFCLTYIEEGQIRVRLQSSDESQPHGAWHHIGCRASPAGKAKVINLDMLLTQDMMDVLGWRDHIDTFGFLEGKKSQRQREMEEKAKRPSYSAQGPRSSFREEAKRRREFGEAKRRIVEEGGTDALLRGGSNGQDGSTGTGPGGSRQPSRGSARSGGGVHMAPFYLSPYAQRASTAEPAFRGIRGEGFREETMAMLPLPRRPLSPSPPPDWTAADAFAPSSPRATPVHRQRARDGSLRQVSAAARRERARNTEEQRAQYFVALTAEKTAALMLQPGAAQKAAKDRPRADKRTRSRGEHPRRAAEGGEGKIAGGGLPLSWGTAIASWNDERDSAATPASATLPSQLLPETTNVPARSFRKRYEDAFTQPGPPPPAPTYLAGSTYRAKEAVRVRAATSLRQQRAIVERNRKAIEALERQRAAACSLTARRLADGFPAAFRADPVPFTQYKTGSISPRVPLDQSRPPPFRPAPPDQFAGSRLVSEACLEALVSPRDLARLAARAPQAMVTVSGITPVQLAQQRLDDDLFFAIDQLATSMPEHAPRAPDANWMLAAMATESYPPDGMLDNQVAPEVLPPLPWRSSVRERAITARLRIGGLDEAGAPLGGLRALLCEKDTSWVSKALAASFASFGARSAR